jgi:hypothetical protein
MTKIFLLNFGERKLKQFASFGAQNNEKRIRIEQKMPQNVWDAFLENCTGVTK